MTDSNTEGTPYGDAGVTGILKDFAKQQAAPEIMAAFSPIAERISQAAKQQALDVGAQTASLFETAKTVLAPQVKSVYEKHTTDLASIEAQYRNGMLGAQGRADAYQRADVQLDARIAALGTESENQLKTVQDVKSGFYADPNPNSEVQRIRAESLTESSFIHAKYPNLAPQRFIHEALEVLERATDPKVAMVERLRANRILSDAYEPLLERRANTPERFARDFAPIAKQVHDAVRSHLDTVLHVNQAAQIRNAKTTIRSQLSKIHHEVKKAGGRWDAGVAQIVAPGLFGEPTILTEK